MDNQTYKWHAGDGEHELLLAPVAAPRELALFGFVTGSPETRTMDASDSGSCSRPGDPGRPRGDIWQRIRGRYRARMGDAGGPELRAAADNETIRGRNKSSGRCVQIIMPKESQGL